eukprot:scaffold163253_cov31-Tisochrysis_lutea.AAC.4
MVHTASSRSKRGSTKAARGSGIERSRPWISRIAITSATSAVGEASGASLLADSLREDVQVTSRRVSMCASSGRLARVSCMVCSSSEEAAATAFRAVRPEPIVTTLPWASSASGGRFSERA